MLFPDIGLVGVLGRGLTVLRSALADLVRRWRFKSFASEKHN